MGENTGYLTANRTKEGDNLFSPYYIVDHIIKYLPKDKVIWCPWDEEWSAFYQRFKECGFKVIRSSLADKKDFFTYEPDDWDIIVSNPPFSIKDKVLDRLYSFNKPFAVLLPLNSLQGKTRYKYFSQGIQLLSFDARVSYHDNEHMDKPVKGSPFATAYFCRDVLPMDLIVEKLVAYDRPLI
ncbi:tRNA (adenine-N(6)-)-methyltransferase [Lactonifactor sp. BIOML-A3]|uniref:tRNA (adenine-N(6)-)-methyltransferase n=1 Tax=unclassified Lactonifactor TaxID=2636670 RepID=UPI0012B0E528|nr:MULTISPECIES: tRNA (adenine-N(6)-)-methyltransferase [unclassified Lactonifactor]MSA02222.1 tRNA (adenine-N(6)-)-methyltransferase [Lactonifactor sp. BIOML-A5]MSA08006.1 tRNA (adenine-N(6)-)-methyltransferase [Lactonifactor sp. BIOML-A4]MSA12622.1 tRNA (adenine-N(6)-)-methyltransferase [Lactonifactor sp. BIOML-A3]MSA16676.1 tRNA (adenine-N(6)-)-methyltransferase [Lactonifactor sp. BIOML-A2]MSA37625.1 tRNA (adenine-N(6)-)-methyltransferase [Lactonifactor sp. BIOML-A1]